MNANLPSTCEQPWMRWALVLAGIYNLVWGAAVILYPNALFSLIGMEPPRYPQIWQCVGMIVGVYGVGYLLAARRPLRHWPIVLVGLLGKLLGPIGFADAVYRGTLPLLFGATIVTHALLWWLRFAWILISARRAHLENVASQRESLDAFSGSENSPSTNRAVEVAKR